MKKILIPLLAVILVLSLAACNSNDPSAIFTETPGATGTPDPTVSADPLAPTPSPSSVNDVEVFSEVLPSDAGFDDLMKKVDMVLLGTIMDDGEEWNSMGMVDENGVYQPDDELFMMEMAYKFKVTECLKGSLKKDDEISYSLFYRSKLRGESDYAMNEDFLAPEKGKTYLIFVNSDPGIEGIYYAEYEPHCFELREDNKIYIYSKSKDALAFVADAAVGIDYASAKKEMGIN